MKVDINSIEDTIITMKAKDEIVLEDDFAGREWVYLKSFYEAEKRIANRLIILRNFENVKKIKSIDDDLKLIQNNISIKLSEKQKEAIKAINDNNVCIITGGPGTGKTTIIKAIIELYKRNGMKPVLCAPTRKSY